MAEMVVYIPLDKIKRIKVYINSSKKTLKQIVDAEGCDYAITGNFYTSAWKATCQLKGDGKVYAQDQYTYWGYSWNTPEDFAMRVVPDDDYANYIACCTLIENGRVKADNEIRYGSDVGGRRGRTAVGLSNGNLVLYGSTDGSSQAKTPEQLKDYAAEELGVKDAFIMMDGGSKVNFYNKGYFYQGSAKSQNLLLVYLKDNKEDEPSVDVEEGKDMGTQIIESFATKNPRYYSPTKKNKIGYMQHSTGTPGAKASYFINSWNKSSCQAEAEFVIDDTGIYQLFPIGIKTWHCGGSGNNTHVACEICEPQDTRFLDANWYNLSQNGKNNTTFAVKALQEELVARGYDTNGVDGIFGSGTKSAVVSFQKSVGLSADGIVGKDTLHALQKRDGCKVKYDAAKNQAYFQNIYNKAVWLCAYVLDQLGITSVTSSNVLSHAEGYKQGIAGNHADVGHWFPEHGKTMDNFREDVKAYIKSGKLPYGDEVEAPEEDDGVADWAAEAWDKACDMGLFDGSSPEGAVTRQQLAVVLDRLGLLK